MIWIKQGVMGRLNPQARKCLGRIHSLFQTWDQDVYVTSIEEGNHGAGSLHYCGDAFDIRKPDQPSSSHPDAVERIAGINFDVVYEATHIHVEFDPD